MENGKCPLSRPIRKSRLPNSNGDFRLSLMEFWHLAMVAGTASFSIPVIIHLMFRMRKKRVVFSSLRFLQKTVLEKTQRMRVREWLLLLLRCLACILIALAFARPFRPGSVLAGVNGKPQEDVVLIVDDSPSLMAQENTSIRWNALLDRARKEVAGHPTGDRVGLVFVSDPSRAEVELSNNFGAFTTPLQRDRPSARRGDLAQALNTGIELLATSQQPSRRIVVYTDLQANQIDKGAWAEAAQKAAAAGRGIAVQIETPSGEQPPRIANLAVTDVRAKSDVWIEGRPIPFAVRVANHGENDVAALTVKLMVDGQQLATKNVGLSPRSTQEIELAAPFPHAGEVSGYVEIEAHDAFPDDDRRYFALHLRDSVKALVIEETLHDTKESFLDEGYYVRMALDPKARGGDSRPDAPGSAQSYVQVQSTVLAKTSAELYANCDLIFMCGITTIGDAELKLLAQAVRDGKPLIVFTGRADGRISEAFYNGPFWAKGLGLLPAPPGKLYQGSLIDKRYHQLGEFKADHPIFKPFVGEAEPFLRMAIFLRHFQASAADLKAASPEQPIPGEKETRPAGQVLATFGDGSPLAMERPYGKGTVLMFNFAPRPEATDLVQRKAFLPLLHQTVRYFAGTNAVSHRAVLAGDSIDFADGGVAADVDVKLTTPDKAKGILALRGTDHPSADALGIYSAEFAHGNMLEKALWAANLDPRESDLTTEDLASIRATFASTPTDKNHAAHNAVDNPWDDERKSQAPDWRYFLVAALACLLLEVLVRDFLR